MPSRRWIIVIVLLWLGSTAWFFAQDFWPRLRSDGSPPFTINVVDEARRQELRWLVTRRDKSGTKEYRAFTAIDYYESDDSIGFTFEMAPLRRKLGQPGITLIRVESEYRCSREGRLDRARMLVRHEANIPGLELGELETEVEVGTTDEEASFQWRRNWAYPLQGEWQSEPVSFHRRLLLPIHPLHQMKGLETGQTWTEPMLDLLPYALSDHLATIRPVVRMKAKIHPPSQETKVRWQLKDHFCRLLTYQGEDVEARIFIQQEEPSNVLRYELHREDVTWLFQRP